MNGPERMRSRSQIAFAPDRTRFLWPFILPGGARLAPELLPLRHTRRADLKRLQSSVPSLRRQHVLDVSFQEVVHSALSEEAEVVEALANPGRTEWTHIRMSLPEAHAGRLWATACKPHGALFQFTIRAEQATVL